MRAWLDGVEVGAAPSFEPFSAPLPDSHAEHLPSVRGALGAGVFETLRVDEGSPFALSRHLARMVASAAATGLPEVDVDLVRRVVDETCRQLEVPSRLRLTWSQGPTAYGPGGLLGVTTSVLPEAGPSVSLVTAPGRRSPSAVLTGHKATSYAESMVAAAYARTRGADEAVLLTPDGRVSEGSATNVFHVVAGEVRTSSLSTGCLPGITRALVLEWFDAREVDADEEQVRAADEVFVTSSTRGPVPVRSWGDRSWDTPGPVTRSLVERWWDRARETRDP